MTTFTAEQTTTQGTYTAEGWITTQHSSTCGLSVRVVHPDGRDTTYPVISAIRGNKQRVTCRYVENGGWNSIDEAVAGVLAYEVAQAERAAA